MGTPVPDPSRGVAVHILCPHCRNPIEVVKLTPEEILCPACGSVELSSGDAIDRRLVAGR
jgi:hypothetical protein